MKKREQLKTSIAFWRRRARQSRAALHRAQAVLERRRLQLRKVETRERTPAQKAVAWALKQVGTVEAPPFSNRGPKVDAWMKAAIGVVGNYAWCMAFAAAGVVAGGAEQLRSAYCPAVVQWAREGKFGLRLVPLAESQPGDLWFFKFPGVSHDVADHVGIYIGNGKTVEGNTSPGVAGSQNNGGGVYIRQRPAALVAAVVRWS